MRSELLVRGFIVGFALAAPVGPIGILVIRRSLAHGVFAGLVSGLGAAVADALFAIAGAFGMLGIARSGHAVFLQLAGGLVLAALGVRGLAQSMRARTGGPPPGSPSHGRAFVSTMALTLASPISILSFAAVAASLGLGRGPTGEAALLVAGVFSGSALWWLVLASATSGLRHRLSSSVLGWVDRAGAFTLLTFGIVAMATARFAR